MPPASKTTGNYVIYLGENGSYPRSYDEAIMLNRDGLVAECTLFVVRGRFYTPPLVSARP